MTAMIVVIKNKDGGVTEALTVKPGERVHFDRYEADTYPHVAIMPVNGGVNGVTRYSFSGSVVVCNADGEALFESHAKEYMAKESEWGSRGI